MAALYLKIGSRNMTADNSSTKFKQLFAVKNHTSFNYKPEGFTDKGTGFETQLSISNSSSKA